jgi:hypothetical protein
MIRQDVLDLIRLRPGKKVRLKDHDTGWAQTKELKELGKDVVKDRAKEILDENLEELALAQELLYADGRYAVLIVLQAMDTAGKDGTIKHVMSGVNPQGHTQQVNDGDQQWQVKRDTAVEIGEGDSFVVLHAEKDNGCDNNQ